jgi:hypothetical protein
MTRIRQIFTDFFIAFKIKKKSVKICLIRVISVP